MNVLDLFSGIGGFSLGLERAGMRTVAFCEIEPYCRAVLRKNWPGVPIYEDVRELSASRIQADGISVDVICGGFPCQDISLAGRGAGLDGAKSGLWSEYLRIIREVRPVFVIIENSPALRTRGGDRVLSGLEALDYACEPFVVGAVHAGAPHRRQRVWLVAYANGAELRDEQRRCRRPCRGSASVIGDDGASGHVADTNITGLEIVLDGQPRECAPAVGAHAWTSEPDVGRVAYGVPARAHRIKALGNAVVPQIPELVSACLHKIDEMPNDAAGRRDDRAREG
jgi:DNA (cytosine-5)-methyltransferase 1